jgi:hypothetical protein
MLLCNLNYMLITEYWRVSRSKRGVSLHYDSFRFRILNEVVFRIVGMDLQLFQLNEVVRRRHNGDTCLVDGRNDLRSGDDLFEILL